jgi:hypothetical protein
MQRHRPVRLSGFGTDADSPLIDGDESMFQGNGAGVMAEEAFQYVVH